MNNQLKEFLDIGPANYCKRHSLQACHLCTKIECTDNQNPIAKELIKYKQIINKLIDLVEHSQNNFNQLLNLTYELIGKKRKT